MTRPRLAIRSRITLLCTGLFVTCGAVLIAITYTLVAALLPAVTSTSVAPEREAYVEGCRQDLRKPDLDPQRRAQCREAVEAMANQAFDSGVDVGAQRQRDETLGHLLWYSLATLAGVAVLAALGGWLIAGRVLRPVQQLTAAARTASEHNLSARVSLRGPRDELRELADTFDDMLGRLHAAFEGQRRFIANASHELRTPLTAMRTTVDVVLSKPAPTPDDVVGMGRDVRTAVDEAEALIGALLTLARNEHGLTVREPVDLADIAEDVLDSVDPGDRTHHTSLQSAVTSGDPVLLERLVTNLVDNAVRYNLPGGAVRVTTAVVNRQPTLVVANTGPVIAPGTVDTLFEPFRRLHDRTTNGGFGLGLAIVASIVAVHDGTLLAHPRPGGGLTITVTLPGTGAPPASVTPP
jgi:signal transduction histidine kinase